MPLKIPDLTRQPPRSPRVRLGGYVILPRLLDKGRAVLAGTQGEYKYACSLDQQFLQFVGVDPEALREQIATGQGDGAILEWIRAHARHPRASSEIAAWSAYQEARPPENPEARAFFNELHAKVAPRRDDVASWFDLLDLDDYASFGGVV